MIMLRVADVMTKDVATIHSSATVFEAVELMNARGWRSLIVDRQDAQDAYGMISETDIAYKIIAKNKNPHQTKVADVMTKPCISVKPDLSLVQVAQLFAEQGLARAPVIQDKLLGIISITDLLTKTNFMAESLPLVLERDLLDMLSQA
jgi:CBS domain-containing protein